MLKSILIALLLSQSFGLMAQILQTPTLAAAQTVAFIPPATSSPRRSQGSGSRGCAQAELADVQLQPVIPSATVAGQTTQSHPSFYWVLEHGGEVPLTLQFSLSQEGADEPLYTETITTTERGVLSVTLPSDRPGLEIATAGESTLYSWSVMLICNAARPSANPYVLSWIERVAPSPELTAALARAMTKGDRATAYADHGIWYDILKTMAAVGGDHEVETYFDRFATAP